MFIGVAVRMIVIKAYLHKREIVDCLQEVYGLDGWREFMLFCV